MDEKVGKCVEDVCSHKTTGLPKVLIARPMEENKKISTKDQQEYWSGVGMLLYLVKTLWPNLANIIMQLSKSNDGANPAMFKELLLVIKYILEKKNLGLKIEPTGYSNKP